MAMRIPASFDGIEMSVPGGKGIYPPSEDTFLLLGLLKRFVESMPPGEARHGSIALDMGPGAGLATIYLARHFSRVHAVDLNPNAVAYVREELARRCLAKRVALIAGSLLGSLRDHPGKCLYTLACFNPPYLPPEDYDAPRIQEEDDGRLHAFYIDKALYAPDGGKAVLEGFLRDAKAHLVPGGGHVFFIKSSLTGIDDVHAWARGFGFTIVEGASVHRFFENIDAYHAIA